MYIDIEQEAVSKQMTRIVNSLTLDPHLREDLKQEALRNLYINQAKFPNETMSWHLQRCRMHVLDYLGQGRSIDSFKRHRLATVIPDHSTEEGQIPAALVVPEVVSEMVSVKDLTEQLEKRLSPMGRRILAHLWEECTLREIGSLVGLSASRVWEYRKEIAATAILLGFSPDFDDGRNY